MPPDVHLDHTSTLLSFTIKSSDFRDTLTMESASVRAMLLGLAVMFAAWTSSVLATATVVAAVPAIAASTPAADLREGLIRQGVEQLRSRSGRMTPCRQIFRSMRTRAAV